MKPPPMRDEVAEETLLILLHWRKANKEFREYFRLWRRIAHSSELEGVLAATRALSGGERRAARMASRLGMERGHEGGQP